MSLDSDHFSTGYNFPAWPPPPPSRVLPNDSIASLPGRVPISYERFKRMQPSFFTVKPWMFWKRRAYQTSEFVRCATAEALYYGLAEPALVVDLDPLLVAAYTDEIDCVVMLVFHDAAEPHPRYGNYYPQGLATELIQRHRLTVGSRLLTVNTFDHISEGYGPDIQPGPRQRKVWGDFKPVIADFLTANQAVVERTKSLIPESNWQRAQELADEYDKLMIDEVLTPRDGRVLCSASGFKQDWINPPH